MNKILTDIALSIIGIFILIIILLLLTTSSIDNFLLIVKALPKERFEKKSFFYFELVDHYVIPVTPINSPNKICEPLFYQAIFLKDFNVTLCYRKVKPHLNEDLFSVFSLNSYFSKYIKKLDPDKVYIVLLTRPSGFKQFYEVREFLRKKGFDVGWYPYEENTALRFSRFGRKVGIQ